MVVSENHHYVMLLVEPFFQTFTKKPVAVKVLGMPGPAGEQGVPGPAGPQGAPGNIDTGIVLDGGNF